MVTGKKVFLLTTIINPLTLPGPGLFEQDKDRGGDGFHPPLQFLQKCSHVNKTMYTYNT